MQPTLFVDCLPEYFYIFTDSKLENVPCLEGDSLKGFLKTLNDICPSAAILSVVEPHATERAKGEAEYNLPIKLGNLFDASFENFNLEQLREVDIDFNITEEERNNVEKITLEQSKNLEWFKFRKGRITASNFKRVCHTSLEVPSLSLLKSICYCEKVSFQIKAMSYGLNHEEIALKEYEKTVGPNHTNFNVRKAGFLISSKLPIIGASPDGIVSCDSCGIGCVEIKCPYRLKDGMELKEFVRLGNCFLYADSEEKFHLKKSHEYYFQIQLQMFVSETKYCDFIVWSKHYLHIERIYIDECFLEQNLEKAVLYHKKIIVPELLSKWFTSANSRTEVELWCDCRKEEDGRQMILCANEDCQIKWFHLDCMNLINLPTLYWFCKRCSIEIFGNITTKAQTPRLVDSPSSSSKQLVSCVNKKIVCKPMAMPCLNKQQIFSDSSASFQMDTPKQSHDSIMHVVSI